MSADRSPAGPGSPAGARGASARKAPALTPIGRLTAHLPGPKLASAVRRRQGGLTIKQRYEIHVRGRLGETICCAFPALQASTQGDHTTLTGVLADQAALYGVLAEMEALGLELIEVRRLPPARPDGEPP